MTFCKLFAVWLNDPIAQLEWLQKNNRVANALVALGYVVGTLPCDGEPNIRNGGLWIANMSGPGSRFISSRPIVMEDGFLQPADLSWNEQREIKRGVRVA
jgi:hypothetical protein